MGRISQIVVLAEGARDQRFVYRYLERLNYSLHDVRAEPVSGGRGCGEQWVRERYAKAVKTYRWRSSRAQTALVVAIDADKGDRDRRVRQLEDSLLQANLPPRAADERIVHLIPKRNIETWVINLIGHAVDEDTDYSHRGDVDEQMQTAAHTFFEWARRNATIPAHCVPSLRLAIDEIRRLE